jgi:hypothetical protein
MATGFFSNVVDPSMIFASPMATHFVLTLPTLC